MATGQPLQTNWEIHPSIVAKMRISLVSWLVSTETDLGVGEASPPGTSCWWKHRMTLFGGPVLPTALAIVQLVRALQM